MMRRILSVRMYIFFSVVRGSGVGVFEEEVVSLSGGGELRTALRFGYFETRVQQQRQRLHERALGLGSLAFLLRTKRPLPPI